MDIISILIGSLTIGWFSDVIKQRSKEATYIIL